MYDGFISHQSDHKPIRLFNSKLMIISITHRIMDAKLYDYWFMGN